MAFLAYFGVTFLLFQLGAVFSKAGEVYKKCTLGKETHEAFRTPVSHQKLSTRNSTKSKKQNPPKPPKK
jgi:hypothetical protein